MATAPNHHTTTGSSSLQRVEIPDTIQSQARARAAVRECAHRHDMGEAATLRGMLIAAEFAADVYHAHDGPALLAVQWRQRRHHRGVLSLTLDTGSTEEWDMPELTELTLDLMATRWSTTTDEHTCHIDAHIEDDVA